MATFVCHGCSDDCTVEKSEKHPRNCLRLDSSGNDFSDWKKAEPQDEETVLRSIVVKIPHGGRSPSVLEWVSTALTFFALGLWIATVIIGGV